MPDFRTHSILKFTILDQIFCTPLNSITTLTLCVEKLLQSDWLIASIKLQINTVQLYCNRALFVKMAARFAECSDEINQNVKEKFRIK